MKAENRTMNLPTVSRETTVTATSPSRPIRLWLVDDDNRLRQLMAEMLGREGDIQCLRDFDSPNGVISALASKEGPDVVLLDIQMGELSGLDAVRPIRSLSRSTRVVMFTSHYDPERHQRAMADGASDFLLKHDRMERIVAHIRNAARQPPPALKPRKKPGECFSPAGAAAARWPGGNAKHACGVGDPSPGARHFFNRCLQLLQKRRP